jgi:SAM-dependent methyltransferase
VSELAASVALEEARIRDVYARRAADQRCRPGNPVHLFMLQSRERAFLKLVDTRFGPLADQRILEIGCGSGQWLLDLIRWGARPDRLTGLDLLPDRIEEARRRCPDAVRLICGSAAATGLAGGAYDIVLQSTAFSSVLDTGVRRAIAAEMLRLLAPAGRIVWYDFFVDNPWNADVRRVGRSEIAALFPGCRVHLTRITLAPPVARALLPLSRVACEMLERMPLFCTHYLGVVTR